MGGPAGGACSGWGLGASAFLVTHLSVEKWHCHWQWGAGSGHPSRGAGLCQECATLHPPVGGTHLRGRARRWAAERVQPPRARRVRGRRRGVGLGRPCIESPSTPQDRDRPSCRREDWGHLHTYRGHRLVVQSMSMYFRNCQRWSPIRPHIQQSIGRASVSIREGHMLTPCGSGRSPATPWRHVVPSRSSPHTDPFSKATPTLAVGEKAPSPPLFACPPPPSPLSWVTLALLSGRPTTPQSHSKDTGQNKW